MLIFRSEDTVAAWCAARAVPVRPLVTLPQLWHLARAWYADRLTDASRRPHADEMAGIFAEVGLTGPFWDPKSDRWRTT